VVAKSKEHLKLILESKGLSSRSYYTFNQLRYVPEFNFKTNKENKKILELFDS
jgi:hypothetical protein